MNKIDLAKKIYVLTIHDILKNKRWTEFLNFMAKFYKYNFENNILMYGQRKDATAIAKYDTWKNLGRNVRRYSKGILIVNGDTVTYGFDISDTAVISKDLVHLWEYNKESTQAIANRLKKQFAIAGDDTFENILNESVENICNKYVNGVQFSKDKEFTKFTNILIQSVSYIVEERLNMQHKEDYNFDEVYENINYGQLLKLGRVINLSSSTILRNIEETIKIEEGLITNEDNYRQYRTTDTNVNEHILRHTGESTIRQSSGIYGNSRENSKHEFREMGERKKEISNGGQSNQISFFGKGNEHRGLSEGAESESRRQALEDGERNEKEQSRTRKLDENSTVLQPSKEPVRRDNPKRDNISRGSGEDSVLESDIAAVNENMNSKELEVNSGSFNLQNFKIDKDKYSYAFSGPKTRFEDNINAIRLLKKLESSNSIASQNEKEVLAKYVGWGGIQEAFDDKNASWANEYKILKNTLSEEEYVSARASVNNAHYTNPIIINSIYEALGRFGFEGGQILEPAAGIGNFIGLMPEDIKGKFTGVEIDSISGRIAKLLYPKANIKIQGFETTTFKNNTFDAAISNVPFGDYKLFDSSFSKDYLIHDYFFLKSLDKVKEDGLIAFITSKGTMDKKNNEIRTLISEKAKFLGAIRLPNNAFKNANTEVTTDIIFLQKRQEGTKTVDKELEWLNIKDDINGIQYNEYFINHPEMMIGEMKLVSSRFGNEPTLIPPKEDYTPQDLQNDLKNRVNLLDSDGINTSVAVEEVLDYEENQKVDTEAIRNFTYNLIDGELYYKDNGEIIKQDIKGVPKERIEHLIELRNFVRAAIDMQLQNCSDDELKSIQNKLLQSYDSFVNKYGYINSKANNVFREDADYPLLCSLEKKQENDYIKADIFFKRTIKANNTIYHVETAEDSLIASLDFKGKVDLEYMSSLIEKTKDELINDLKTVIYLNPEKFLRNNDKYICYETADEYLSGNVKEKLKFAISMANNNPEFKINIEALKKVIPEDISAGDIDVKLGSTWVPSEYIRQFAIETFLPNSYTKDKLKVEYYDILGAGTWKVSGYAGYGMQEKEVWGTKRYDCYEILEGTLNFKTIKVFDTIDEKRVLNTKQTLLAQEKQEKMGAAFKQWIFKDPERREKLVRLYNDTFNNIRVRTYDGSNLKLPGINPLIKLRPNQLNAVNRVVSGGSALLGHVVGAGKTYTMISAGMELRRLGISKKNMYAVPNHLVEQWGQDFLTLYPSANILVATKKDFEKQNRKKFVSRIATGDYDAVIIAHSSFEKIAVSKERQEKLIRKEIADITDYISKTKLDKNEGWSIKQMERTAKSLDEKLKRLLDDTKKDDLLNFEQLGVDYLFIDEAHMYKNCAKRCRTR